MSEANKKTIWKSLLQNKGFKNEWIHDPTKKDYLEIDSEIAKLFEAASKSGSGTGYPDFIYYNKDKNLLIIAEVKEDIIKHGNPDEYNQNKRNITSVDGIKHYLYKIMEKDTFKKLKLNIVGLALSGNPKIEFSNKISTFIVKDDQHLVSENITENLLTENEYNNLFLNIDKSDSLNKLKNVANTINNLMRDISVSERPILLAGIIIALYENSSINISSQQIKKMINSNVLNLDYDFIKRNMTEDISNVLKKSGISPEDKIESVTMNIKNILNNKAFINNDILKKIFIEINSIMHILIDNLEFDVMGDFYQTFLRYTSGDGGDLGIILTPLHITEFMIEVLNILKDGGININDIILDPCCGTGTFLTSFMNFQINNFAMNDISKKNYIKENNLIGVEINSTMYTLAIANMLVRGDGKSSIHEDDIFSISSSKLKNIKMEKPTIGLMNPPYSQSNKKDSANNKSEMEFIEKLINSVQKNGYVAVISSKSTFFKSHEKYRISKENIYKNNTLKCVINMPKDLFSPVASTITSIAFFQVGRPHQLEDEVYFYNMETDGFTLLKNNRLDLYDEWNNIKSITLTDIKNKNIINGKSILIKNLTEKDEWIPEQWIPIDFENILNNEGDKIFDKIIKEYTLFKFKEKTGILDKELNYNNEKDPILKERIKKTLPSELELFELIQETGLNALEIIGDENE